MSPEFGSTCAIFPVDAETLRYLEFTGRPTERSSWSTPTRASRACSTTEDSEEPTFSDTLELDLGDVEPSIAGPKRPQDRIALADAKAAFLESLQEFDPDAARARQQLDEAIAGVLPRLRPAGRGPQRRARQAAARGRYRGRRSARRSRSPSRSRTARDELDPGRA
jgi:aconitate hydratase